MGDVRPIIKQSPPIDLSTPYSPASLSRKTILITGAANGLGAHLARHLASHGSHLLLGDIDTASGEALVADLRRTYPEQTFFYGHCDVTDFDSQARFFEEAMRASPEGRVEVVVPNAGVHLHKESTAFENPVVGADGKIGKPLTLTLDVNITGAYYTTHLALHYLSLNPDPNDRCILLIGSLASFVPLPGQAPYAISKHAILGMFRSLVGSTFTKSIRINMINPYFVTGSRMFPAGVEAIFLSGSAGAASIPDVIDAATRLIADEDIKGRSLAIGPRMLEIPDGEPELSDWERKQGGRGIREVYAEDYTEVETFRWRYVRMMNGITALRGWVGWATDAWKVIWAK